MAYWLSPIYKIEPLSIGKERIKLNETKALALRDAFVKLQPFFLPFLKTHILPEGDDENVCGVDYFSLEGDEGIVFDGNPLMLSKCGGAFINKLPTLKEIKQNREKYRDEIGLIQGNFIEMMDIVESWWDKDWIVVIFKE